MLLLVILKSLLGLNLYALTLGIVPQQSPYQLMKVWHPVVQYLEKESGEKVVLRIERSIPEFEKTLYSGGFDFAYMNPYHYVVAHKKGGFIATVRADKNLAGIILVNKKSSIEDVSMIQGKSFLFPAPNAFAATLLVKYELLKNYGIDVDKEDSVYYVNSHTSVYKGVARGVGDLGGGIERTFHNLKDKQTKESLKILYKTKAYPSHPFAFKPSLSPDVRKKLTNALLKMPKKLLDSLSIKKMIRTDDAEYKSVRDLSKHLFVEEK